MKAGGAPGTRSTIALRPGARLERGTRAEMSQRSSSRKRKSMASAASRGDERRGPSLAVARVHRPRWQGCHLSDRDRAGAMRLEHTGRDCGDFVDAWRRLDTTDQRLGVDLLLDVERRRVDHEVAPVLLVLAAPDELQVQVAVAGLIGDAHRVLRLLLQHRLVFRGRDVPARRLLVAERLYRLAARSLRGLRS